MAAQTSGGLLTGLSDELAAAVEHGGRSVVTVDGRPRLPASGLVWSEGDVIVTANHVLERDDQINVTFAGGRTAPATIAGRDPGSDLAILRVAGDLPVPAEAAPDGSVRVGHLAIAVGRPGGGSVMASLGIVSAIGGTWRTAQGGVLDGYVRADVTLFPGVSGGPLIDTRGRVIGLLSWHLAHGQEIAIPARSVAGIVRTLVAHGRVRRGYLGVTTQPVELSAAIRAAIGREQAAGLVVLSVEAGSPAERAGLLIGDILIAIGGQPVAGAEDLRAALGADRVDQATNLEIARGGERREISVTPAARE